MDNVLLQLILLLAFGLLQLFFGYQLFRLLVVLAGAVVGFAYGPSLLATASGGPVEPWMALVAAATAAVILGLLAWLAFWLVVFLWGASIGYGAADPLSQSVIVPLLAALGVGVLAVVFQKVLIVLLTALSGSWLTVTAGAMLLGLRPPMSLAVEAADPWLLIIALALAAAGASVQFRRSAGLSR